MKKKFCDYKIKNRYLIWFVLAGFFLGSFLGVFIHSPVSASYYYLEDFDNDGIDGRATEGSWFETNYIATDFSVTDAYHYSTANSFYLKPTVAVGNAKFWVNVSDKSQIGFKLKAISLGDGSFYSPITFYNGSTNITGGMITWRHASGQFLFYYNTVNFAMVRDTFGWFDVIFTKIGDYSLRMSVNDTTQDFSLSEPIEYFNGISFSNIGAGIGSGADLYFDDFYVSDDVGSIPDDAMYRIWTNGVLGIQDVEKNTDVLYTIRFPYPALPAGFTLPSGSAYKMNIHFCGLAGGYIQYDELNILVSSDYTYFTRNFDLPAGTYYLTVALFGGLTGNTYISEDTYEFLITDSDLFEYYDTRYTSPWIQFTDQNSWAYTVNDNIMYSYNISSAKMDAGTSYCIAQLYSVFGGTDVFVGSWKIGPINGSYMRGSKTEYNVYFPYPADYYIKLYNCSIVNGEYTNKTLLNVSNIIKVGTSPGGGGVTPPPEINTFSGSEYILYIGIIAILSISIVVGAVTTSGVAFIGSFVFLGGMLSVPDLPFTIFPISMLALFLVSGVLFIVYLLRG